MERITPPAARLVSTILTDVGVQGNNSMPYLLFLGRRQHLQVCREERPSWPVQAHGLGQGRGKLRTLVWHLLGLVQPLVKLLC